MSIATAKVPAAVVSGVVALMIGLGCGLLIGRSTTTPAEKPVETAAAADDGDKAKQPGDGEKAKQSGGGKGGKGGGPKVGGGGGGQAKTQLTQLIAKLDLLTHKPPLPLSAEQKQKLKALLADIDAADDMSQEEARTRLDAILAVVEEQKLTVQAAGFAWPGAASPPQTKQNPNPFNAGPASVDVIHLKALRAYLDTKD